MATGARRSRNGLRDPQEMTRAPLQTNSDAHRNLRYSYTPTPTEFQRPVFEQFSPADSTIDESPISPQEGGRTNFAERAMNAHFPPAHASVPPTSGPNTPAHPHGIHPAHFAPYAEPAHQPEAPGHLQEPQSPGPLPIKVDRVPTSPKAATIHNSPHEERKLGFPGLAPATDHRPLVYNPDSLVGPNVAHETHRPGQVLHPNGTVEPEWKHGLCEVDTLCCTGIFCPCMVYGKTQYRLSRKQQKQEPTDLLGYESCNLSCGIMAAACGFQWVLAAFQRNRIRRLYKINGDFGSDCLKALCCCCCVIMQDEREVRHREDQIRRHAGPASGAYIAPGTMTYAPPPR